MSEPSLNDIFTTYYRSPSPALAAAALETEARRDSQLDEGQMALEVYFFSAIARGYPPIVRDYEAVFDRQPTPFVLSVLAQVGDEGTQQFVAARLRDERFRGVRPQMRALVNGEATERIDPLASPVRTALDLDLLWAEFLVTGNTIPVERIIDVLEWPDLVRARMEFGLRLPPVVRFLGEILSWMPGWRINVPAEVIISRFAIDIDRQRRVVETPEDLDCLCIAPHGKFGGDQEAWRLISPYLSKSQRERVKTKTAAWWSLGANAIQHPRVLEVCEAQVATRSGRARLALLEISAVARLSRGDHSAAAAWARRYLELSPGNKEMLRLLDRATRGSRARAEVKAVTDSLGASSPAHDAYTRGLLLDEDDQVDQAVDAFQEAIDSGDPKWGPKAEFQLGMILREGGDEAGAERAYRHVIDSSDGPELGAALLNLGALLMAREEREAAKETLSRALEVGGPTERGMAAANLGNIAKDQGEIESAHRFYELAKECSRDDAPEPDDLLEALEAAGRTTKVLKRKDALREARVLAGASAGQALANLRMSEENRSGAIEAFRQVIAFDHPEVTMRAKAELAGQLLPVDEAKKLFHEVIASGHDQWGPMASVNLGVLLEEQGDLQGAKEAYRRGAQFTDPESGGRAARYLGDLQAQEGDVAGAVESYRRAMESESEDGVAAAFSLASLLATSGDKNGASEIYERLSQMPWPEARSEAQRELRELKGSALGRLFHRR